MESLQKQWTLNHWLPLWPPEPESSLLNYSTIRYSPCSTLSDHSSSPLSALTSPTPPENPGLNGERVRGSWNSTDQIQPPHGHLFPCTVQYPDTGASYAHDPTTVVSTLPPDPYSVKEQFYNAIWRRADELEPKDPTTGRSVLHALLEECIHGNKGRISKCRLCNRTFSRADRAITHLRHKHLNHRPFSCGGACGTQGCRQRFHSQENLTPHLKPKVLSCPRCSYKCLRQNLKRHIQKTHLEQLGT